MTDYDFQTIEARWQERWAKTGAFEVSEHPSRPKYYCLEMLPYPSGHIHVGHVRNYCITDVISRSKTMRGFNVMHPIGWDALGLPAENAAIQRGVHPEKWTRDNIASMKRQLQRMGFSYDWSREIATCDAEYYRWNQWFFLRMLERGIAYRANSPVNWCPSCQTVLANEQAEGGICWRCKSEVEQRDMEQWFLRITAYQDQLLDDMAQLEDWPDRVLVQRSTPTTTRRSPSGWATGARADMTRRSQRKTRQSMRTSLWPGSWCRSRTQDDTSGATTEPTRTGHGVSAGEQRVSSRGQASLRSISRPLPSEQH
jgi:leucyl-tRNA synthetase family protein